MTETKKPERLDLGAVFTDAHIDSLVDNVIVCARDMELQRHIIRNHVRLAQSKAGLDGEVVRGHIGPSRDPHSFTAPGRLLPGGSRATLFIPDATEEKPAMPKPETVTVEAWVTRGDAADLCARGVAALRGTDLFPDNDGTSVPVTLTLPAAPKPNRTEREAIEAALAALDDGNGESWERNDEAARILREAI